MTTLYVYYLLLYVGEANGNPLSPQFRGKLADFALQGLVRVVFTPSPEYLARHKETIEASRAAGEASVELPPLTDADNVVTIHVALQYVLPSRLTGAHPAVVVPAGVLSIPLVELKRAAKEAFAKLGDEYHASLVKIGDSNLIA